MKRHHMRDDCARSHAEGYVWHSALRENPLAQTKMKQRCSETAMFASEPCQLVGNTGPHRASMAFVSCEYIKHS